MPSILQPEGRCSFSHSSHEWRRSMPFSPLIYDDGSPPAHQSGGGFGCTPRLSFSYFKLPPQLLRLSVLKLDGSSFDVQVAKTASVSELRQAVEEVFSQSPKEGKGKISWSHVWGHFCLCYESYKLVNDKTSLRDFGIKDGDQLQFIRHLSVYHDPLRKTHSRNDNTLHEQHMMQSSKVTQQEQGNEKEGGCDDDEDEDQEYMMGGTEFKLAHFLRGWLSYTRLWLLGRVRLDVRPRYLRLEEGKQEPRHHEDATCHG